MKAVLLIDMPSNCYECPLRTQEFDLYYSHYACQELYTITHEEEGVVEEIRKTCPLKQLPQKRMPKENGKQGLLKLVEQCCDIGFNACLDEITGEEECKRVSY